MARFSIMIMPKCTGSTPRVVTMGSRIGVMIRISGAMSIIVPSSSSRMLIISSTTYLSFEILVNTPVICCGICIRVMM